MTAVRETREETGFNVSVRHLIGAYTDSDITSSNGKQAQSIVTAYELQTVSGGRSSDQRKTLELNYYSGEEKLHLFAGSQEALWMIYSEMTA